MDAKQLEDQFKNWKKLKFYSFFKDLTNKPDWRVALVTCMDCRITSEVFGVKEPGKAIIIRNAGALLTPDSLRSIIISIYELDVKVIFVVGHTDCGAQMNDKDMSNLLIKIVNRSGQNSGSVLSFLGANSIREAFLGFRELDHQIHKTVETIKKNPLIPSDILTMGFIYDTSTGEIKRTI
ncbi:MAG: beta-class carbonic anhydrase [Candidatus Hodarchaeales archaeon]